VWWGAGPHIAQQHLGGGQADIGVSPHDTTTGRATTCVLDIDIQQQQQLHVTAETSSLAGT
jgi:hypothetical protein